MTNLFAQHFNNSRKLLQQNKLLEALEAIEACVDLQSNNADAISQRGVTHFHLKNQELALSDFNLAVNLEPNNPYRYSSRAYVRAAYKDFKGAEEDYLKTLELDPKDEIAHNNYGLLLENKGRMQEAKKHFDTSDEISGIDLKAINLQQEINKENKLAEKNPPKKENTWTVLQSVFTNKTAFKEFVDYIKRGFKHT